MAELVDALDLGSSAFGCESSNLSFSTKRLCMKKISIVTTCMGRLDHLKQTLPDMIHPDIETIVVDYSCPNQCGEWVNEKFPTVKVVKVEGEAQYDASKARNVGALAATSDWICMVDADVFVNTTMLLSAYNRFEPCNYYVRMPTQLIYVYGYKPYECPAGIFREWQYDSGRIDQEKTSTFGFIVYPREALNHVTYDEMFGPIYGHEDMDFRYSLNLKLRYNENIIQLPGIIDVIQHPDDIRTENMNSLNKTHGTSETKKVFFQKWRDLRKKSGLIVNEKIHPVKR